jgi:hypothetical protein
MARTDSSTTVSYVNDNSITVPKTTSNVGTTTDNAGGQAYTTALNNANNGIGPNNTTNTGTANTTTSGASATSTGGWTTSDNSGATTTFNNKGEVVNVSDAKTTGTPNSNTTAPNTNSNNTPTGEGEGFTLGTPDGNGGFEDKAGNPVDANGVPISPVPREVYSDNPQPNPSPTPPSDWRVRLSLAPSATYLYKDISIMEQDILYPLKGTKGVIFPYLPQINVAYKANYSAADIVHTNYKNWFYTHSSVDEISITADFTAQDNIEAKYMLAVIHFFKSVTKMFYGQDSNPRGGTPPPLCYLTGLGAFQFNNNPMVISNFAYNLPNDVDYIRTDTSNSFSGGGMTNLKGQKPKGNMFSKFLSDHRLAGASLNKNATPPRPNFSSITTKGDNITYVPTKLQIQITGHPVVTRKDISENFKITGADGYGSGALTKNNGIW